MDGFSIGPDPTEIVGKVGGKQDIRTSMIANVLGAGKIDKKIIRYDNRRDTEIDGVSGV